MVEGKYKGLLHQKPAGLIVRAGSEILTVISQNVLGQRLDTSHFVSCIEKERCLRFLRCR